MGKRRLVPHTGPHGKAQHRLDRYGRSSVDQEPQRTGCGMNRDPLSSTEIDAAIDNLRQAGRESMLNDGRTARLPRQPRGREVVDEFERDDHLDLIMEIEGTEVVSEWALDEIRFAAGVADAIWREVLLAEISTRCPLRLRDGLAAIRAADSIEHAATILNRSKKTVGNLIAKIAKEVKARGSAQGELFAAEMPPPTARKPTRAGRPQKKVEGEEGGGE